MTATEPGAALKELLAGCIDTKDTEDTKDTKGQRHELEDDFLCVLGVLVSERWN